MPKRTARRMDDSPAPSSLCHGDGQGIPESPASAKDSLPAYPCQLRGNPRIRSGGGRACGPHLGRPRAHRSASWTRRSYDRGGTPPPSVALRTLTGAVGGSTEPRQGSRGAITDPQDPATGQISPDSETLTAGLTGEAFIQS